MAGDREDFLRRWSRRKQDAVQGAPAASPAPAAAAPLPPVESLTPDSDFSAFMRAKVDEGVKRAALKKLFTDPRFNVIDGLDIYIDDYSNLETIPPEIVATLEHAKSTLLRREPEKPPEQAGAAQAARAPDAPEDKDDGGAAG